MRSLGSRGEALAARHLKEAGLQIIRRNYKCPSGEADIIARDGPALVFVEVKARSSAMFGLPHEAVDRRKRRKLVDVAHSYLRGLKEQPPVRFDVVSVLKGADGGFKVEHIRDAFGLEEGW